MIGFLEGHKDHVCPGYYLYFLIVLSTIEMGIKNFLYWICLGPKMFQILEFHRFWNTCIVFTS
jgi:hypothetical protein